MASLTTIITLTLTLVPADHHPIRHTETVDTLEMCWAIARELTERAEEGPLRINGGIFTAACTVKVDPSVEH